MPDYRIYMLDKENHIIDVVPVDYPTDDDALARAAELGRIHHAIEVWIRLRHFARFESCTEDCRTREFAAATWGSGSVNDTVS
jgi:hypothetical protein